MDRDAVRIELKTLRRRLETRFAEAKARADQPEMDRLVGIAGDIDALLAELALIGLAQLVASVDDIRSRLEGRASTIGSRLATASLRDIERILAEVMGQTGEEAVPLRDSAGPAPQTEPGDPIDPEPLVLSAVAAPEPLVEPATRPGTRPGSQAHPGQGDAPEVSSGRLILSEAHLVALWKRSLFPIDGGGIIVFGLRGCRPVETAGTALAPGHEIILTPVNYTTMNCTLGHWRPGAGLALFPGSTVPFGPAVEKHVARNGVGVNQIGRGRYKKYSAGWHKRSDGPGGHWALLQDCAITLQRTGDDADFDLLDRWEAGRIAGDNIHCAFHMGFHGGGAVAGFSSLGCQTVAGTVKKGARGSEAGAWRRFIEPFQDRLGAQKRCAYVLFSAEEAQQMIRTRLAGKTVLLRMGSAGPLVADLQAALNAVAGASVAVDGDFGVGTFQAVIDFQTAVFGPDGDDGIVGPETAARLGLTLPQFDFDDAIGGGPGHSDPGGPGGGGGPGGDGGLRPPVTAPRSGGHGPVAPGSVSFSPAAPGPASPGTALAWGRTARARHGQAFNDRVIAIANGLGADPNHLMAAMAFESADSFRTDIANPISGATGLIQFMDFTAKELDTSLPELAMMSGLEQLDFVERYFQAKARGRRLVALSDVYMAILWPKAIGALESFVLFSEGERAYAQNKPLDINKNGAVTKAEATSKVQDKLVLGMKPDRFG
ncbi:MAG: peptidoglycan-binding protein [Pseudomonadota bacterium]